MSIEDQISEMRTLSDYSIWDIIDELESRYATVAVFCYPTEDNEKRKAEIDSEDIPDECVYVTSVSGNIFTLVGMTTLFLKNPHKYLDDDEREAI